MTLYTFRTSSNSEKVHFPLYSFHFDQNSHLLSSQYSFATRHDFPRIFATIHPHLILRTTRRLVWCPVYSINVMFKIYPHDQHAKGILSPVW